ncbi:MAG TPA: 16S rRNA (guanine(527)-N(7))-methyltransferase RsmG [Candidatus Dormibacteraeota bacterium]
MSNALEARERELVERYLDELYRWAPRLNLTTVPRERAWSRHIEESLQLLEVAAPPRAARLCDLGSGAGLPGIPIAVVRPDVTVVLCDADRRRCGFLTHVCGLLELPNTSVTAARAEVVGRAVATRERFDAVVSRALANPAVLCELALPLLRVGGRLTALVAGAPAAAEQARTAAAELGGGAPYAGAPGVMVVEKLTATPDRYPRRSGVPASRPLR